jgi:hypothetical protein
MLIPFRIGIIQDISVPVVPLEASALDCEIGVTWGSNVFGSQVESFENIKMDDRLALYFHKLLKVVSVEFCCQKRHQIFEVAPYFVKNLVQPLAALCYTKSLIIYS